MPAAPQDIGPYRIVRPLGQGGMGAVYLAYDTRLGREVALKLFSGPQARSAFAREELLREARAAASLNHHHIASVHDVLDVDGQVGIVFEYVHGETLAKRIQRGRLSAAETITIGTQLADALDAAHRHGIVHRDLKPANVAITDDGVVKVLDFGVAHVVPEVAENPTVARTTAGYFVGTVGYAAPEQCMGQSVDARADVFSLGVVMFEMLTGERPFAGSHVTSVLRAMVKAEAPLASSKAADVPRDLDALLGRMLAADPAARPATAGEVLQDLRALVPTGQGAMVPAAPRRRRWVVTALAVAAAVTAGLVGPLWPSRATSVASASTPPVVAVMPLTNASGDPANDYLVIGIAESLVTRLAALPNVAVLSRAAVSDARRTATDVQSLVNALDASFIVDGTVQQNDAQLRISLSLMRPNGTVIWADSVEGPFNSIFSLQTQLASALTNALSIQSSAAQRASLARQPTMNPEALALYWQGRALLERRDVTGNVERALMAFDAAIRVDPRFADAHAGRGEALWAKYLETRDSVFAYDAISAGNEALRLAPDRPHVRYSLALALEGTGRLNEAIEELDRALALQPNYDDARRRLAQVLARQGRLDDAIAQFQKAIDIRPNYWGNYSALGVNLFQAARYREALEAFRQVARLQPDSPSGFQQMGATYQQMGDLDAALEHFRKANAIAPLPQSYSGIGAVLHQKGDYQGAVDAYTLSLELRPNSHITKRNLGDALRRLGRSSAATTAYREAAALVDAELKVNPRDSRLLAFLAVYLAKVGDPRALERIREARLLSPTDVQVVYRSAVVNALAGRQSEALADLGEALKLGYSATFAAADDDFDAIRHLPQFQQLVKR